MRSFLFVVLKFVTLCVGAVFMGLLMVPAGVLVMLMSFIWKTTDKVVSQLERMKGERGTDFRE